MYSLRFLMTILCHLVVSTAINAHEIHSLTEIEDAVFQCVQDTLTPQQTPENEFRINVSKLDQRLRLAQCESPITTEVEFGQLNPRNMIVKVGCSHPTKWSIRVPVKVQNIQNVVVASRHIMKDELITENELSMVKQDIYQFSGGVFLSKEPLMGLVAQKNIPPGTPIKQTMLKQPTLVHRGETVKIIMQSPGLSVEALGVALNDGTKGQPIRIKNVKTQKVIEAIVLETGIVTIHL